MPNVWGQSNLNCNGYSTGGVLYNSRHTFGNSGGGGRGGNALQISTDRSSSQYQNISEVRVKSIISNGFIKLY